MAINASTNNFDKMTIKLDKMASKEDLKTAVVEAVAPIQKHVTAIEENLGKLITRVSVLESAGGGGTEIRVSKLEELLKKGGVGKDMEEIKQMFEALETSKISNIEEKDVQKCTAVFGGFSNAQNIEEAKTWMTDKLWGEWLPQPENFKLKRRIQRYFLWEIPEYFRTRSSCWLVPKIAHSNVR